jgi:hypothetical protein
VVGLGRAAALGERARIPNPGQPATAERPALETLREAGGVVARAARRCSPSSLAAGGAARRDRRGVDRARRAHERGGFSGEGRYLLPGAALLAVAGAAGAARLPAPAVAVAVVAVAIAAVPRADDLAELPGRLDHQRMLATDVEHAVDRAGGPEAILACGRPAVGRYRGTLLAWHLDVPKRTVRADGGPAPSRFEAA